MRVQFDAPDLDESLSAFVRRRRKANHLTQAQLGELVGVGRRFIVELEKGKTTLRMDVVDRVLAAFGFTYDPGWLAIPSAGRSRSRYRSVPSPSFRRPCTPSSRTSFLGVGSSRSRPGSSRATWLEFAMYARIPERPAARILAELSGKAEEAKSLIANSYLGEEMKAEYAALIEERSAVLL